MYDVTVIGGGLMGSYVAYKLAEMDYGVVVLERHEQVGERGCCTGIVSQECMSSFTIDKSVVLREANSARLFSPSGRLLRLWRKETQASILDRPALDRMMAAQARKEGAEYRFGCLATGLEVGGNSVNVKATCQGEGINLESRVVVIATGFNPKFTEGLGLGKIDDFTVGAQAEVEVSGVDEIEVYLGRKIAPGFFAWLVPISSRRALVGLLTRHNPGLYLKKLLLSLLSQGKIASAEVEPVYGGVPLKPLPKTCGERLVVVGDAAGQVKPTTGGGIYFGLLSAEIAVATLHRGLTNDTLSARGLADYERGWRRKLGRELGIDYYARKFYERLSDQRVDRIFDIIKSHGIDESLLKAEDLSFDWHSRAILRLMGHRAVSKALEVMKMPFRPGK